jgi:hypothetical protein
MIAPIVRWCRTECQRRARINGSDNLFRFGLKVSVAHMPFFITVMRPAPDQQVDCDQMAERVMTARINAHEESFSFTIIRGQAFVRWLEKWPSPTFTADRGMACNVLLN